MEEDFRVLHQDQIRVLPALFLVCLQKGQHIDAAHPFSHASNRISFLLPRPLYLRRDGKSLLHIQVHGIPDRISAPVLPKVFIHPSRKRIQIQIIQFVFQQLRRLQCIQLLRSLPADETDTGKTVVALLRHVKHAAPRPHLFEQIVLLEHEKVILKPLQIPFRIHIIDVRENPRNITVVLSMSVAVADPSFPVDRIFKGKLPVLKRRELFAEIPVPRFVSPVGADYPVFVKPLQIRLRDLQRDHDLYIGKILLKILLTDFIVASHCADGVQHRSLPRVIFSHQDQCIFNPADMHVFDRFKISDP